MAPDARFPRLRHPEEPFMSSLFDAVEMAPRDPILGLNEQFVADPNPAKVNLGVGVYYDESGKLPLLRCIREAEKMMIEAPQPRGYLPIDGIAAYDAATQALVFGDAAARREGRIATIQAVGGTGGLKVGADLLQRLNPAARVLISEPSWENHRALFEGAGFEVRTYPYYDAATKGVDFEAMRAALAAAAPGTIVVLHACCHNPTGCDLSADQWPQVVELLASRRLVPFLDMAYQGFGDGIAEDARAVQLCLDAGLDFFVATSYSKSFSLYGERAGALSVVCATQDAATRVLSQLKRVIRTNYSNPPTHGAAAITTVLSTPALRAIWEGELAGMRERIKRMRVELQRRLVAAGAAIDTDFITRQRGMFSYSGLGKAQMQRLRSEFGVYGVDSGRICVAALNDRNLDAVVAAIAQVTEKASA
jgi:aromatic-amino-acid transaminase